MVIAQGPREDGFSWCAIRFRSARNASSGLVGLSARQGRAVVWKRGKSSSAAGGESVYSGVGEVVMMAWSRDRSAPGERGRNERRRHPVDQLDTGRPCDTAELTPRKAREHGASPGPSPARMRRRAASHAFY